MRLFLFLFLVFPLIASAEEVAPLDCEVASTTAEMTMCAGRVLDAAEAEYAKYFAAAKQHMRLNAEADAEFLDEAHPTSFPILAEMEQADAAFKAYRKAECDAVYTRWKAGTIRSIMNLTCQTTLTRARTHTVWQNYLAYVDSTPPLLPEPNYE